MLTLALDTSTPTGSVALLEEEALLAEASAEVKGRHGELLIGTIAGVLEAAGRTMAQVDLIAVGIGPGSFTGVRIGVATAKGLSFANGVPLVGVVSLRAIACGLGPGEGCVAPLAHAHRGEVFGAVYRRGPGGPEEVLAPFHALPPAASRAVLDAAAGEPLLIAGDGYRQFEDQFEGPLAAAAKASPALDLPSGVSVGREGRRAFLADGPDDPALLEPLYVRASDAKLPVTPLKI